MDFSYFKCIVGITLVMAFIISFMNIISLENYKLLIEQSKIKQ